MKEDFHIYERKINKCKSLDLKDSFDLSRFVKATKTDLIYECGKKMRIFKVKDKFVFVDESFLKNIESFGYYGTYGIDEATPILFYSKDVSYIALPFMALGFPYEIRRKESEDKE